MRILRLCGQIPVAPRQRTEILQSLVEPFAQAPQFDEGERRGCANHAGKHDLQDRYRLHPVVPPVGELGRNPLLMKV